MANKGIRKHQPLRVPSNWNDESRRFVIQLEQILDDIYMRFGRLGLKDFEDEVAEKIEGAADDSTVVHKAGTEDIAGAKTFKSTDGLIIKPSSRYKTIKFVQNNSETNNITGIIRQDAGNATNQSINQMYFIEYSPYTTAAPGNTGKMERYFLPAPDKEPEEATRDYKILTSKTPVSIAQGGTGSATAADAVEALGLGHIQFVGAIGGSSASTYTKDFTTTGSDNHHAAYLITLTKYNAPGACNALYLLYYYHNMNTPSSSRGNLVPIVAAQGGVTSFTQTTSTTEAKTTLTLTSSSTYVYGRIIQIYSNL